MAITAPSTLSPELEAYYAAQRRQLDTGYGGQLAQNEYNYGQTSQSYEDQRRDLMKRYRKVQEGTVRNFNRRGLLGSGLYQQGQIGNAEDQANMLGEWQRNRAGALGQYDLLRTTYENQRQAQLGTLEAQRAASIAGLILQLQGIGG